MPCLRFSFSIVAEEKEDGDLDRPPDIIGGLLGGLGGLVQGFAGGLLGLNQVNK
jgi:hypothetical protein